MTGTENQIAWLSDPRLAAHAMSPQPAWLWSADGSRILWANPTGAAIFGAATPAAAADVRFDAKHSAAVQVARLAGTLPQGGAGRSEPLARLERLRGFGAPLAGTLICMVSRITLADNSAGILVLSTERAGNDLVLPERARRIVADFEVPAALFTADGEWVEGKPEAQSVLADKRDLVALGAEKLAREATLNGSAEGEITAGHVTLIKLGDDTKFFLLMLFTAAAAPAAVPPSSRKYHPLR